MDGEKSNATTETKKHFPIKRVALSVLTGLAAFALFWGVYFFFFSSPSANPAEYAGEYALFSAQSGGAVISAESDSPALSLTLYENGKCLIKTSGQSLSGRWFEKEGKITALCGAVKLTGRILNGELNVETKTGGTMNLKSTAPANEEAATTPAGRYKLTALNDNGTEYSAEVLRSTDAGEWYIALTKRGTGRAQIFSESAENITADGESIALRSMRLDYTLDGNTLTLAYPGGVVLTFEKD